MGNKLFIGGLSWDTNDDTLRTAFESFGRVEEARIILDRDTGRSRGFGFVTFEDASAAKRAIEEMDGADLDGRSLRVNEATDRAPRGGGGGGGGFAPEPGRGGFDDNRRGGGRGGRKQGGGGGGRRW